MGFLGGDTHTVSITTVFRAYFPTLSSMTIAKLSVSIDSQLLTFLEDYQAEYQLKSKSEVVSQALKLLRARELGNQYAQAMQDWKQDAEVWETVTGDGLFKDSK